MDENKANAEKIEEVSVAAEETAQEAIETMNNAKINKSNVLFLFEIFSHQYIKKDELT